MSKIKICGLKSIEDIEMINRLQPDYCGFIINFPKSHRSRTPDEVRELVRHLDKAAVIPVGVFVDEDPKVAAELLIDGTIAMAQLHGAEDEDYICRLRELIGEGAGDGKTAPIIKAFKIRNEEDVRRAIASSADYILLDQGQGSGETFDWSVLSGIAIDRPWFLAGGLKSANIGSVIEIFAPFAVDLSSAVETEQKKDPKKVEEIIGIVRSCG